MNQALQTIPDFHSFQINESDVLENRIGEYMVMSMTPPNMIVEYLETGRQQELEIKGQKKAVLSLMRERREAFIREKYSNLLNNLKDKGERLRKLKRIGECLLIQELTMSEQSAFTVGFLASNSKVWAEVGYIYLPTFKAQYKQMTGDDDDPYVPKNDHDQFEMRVSFPYPDERVMNALSFPNDIRIRQRGSKRLIINFASFFWGLIQMGFRMGKYQDTERIRQSIPEELHGRYEQGMREGLAA